MAKACNRLEFLSVGQDNSIPIVSTTNGWDEFGQIPEVIFSVLLPVSWADGSVCSWLYLSLSLLLIPVNECCAIIYRESTVVAKLIKLVIYH
jgi:hypothetical protein